MKRAGARWAEPGAQAIMGLRSLATSDAKRWGAAIKQVLASYRHEVRPLSARDASVIRLQSSNASDQLWNRTLQQRAPSRRTQDSGKTKA